LVNPVHIPAEIGPAYTHDLTNAMVRKFARAIARCTVMLEILRMFATCSTVNTVFSRMDSSYYCLSFPFWLRASDPHGGFHAAKTTARNDLIHKFAPTWKSGIDDAI
jgi:hypothetical protein